MAYFSALSPHEILESDAVAVTFAARVLGPLAVLVPFFVACSCVGSLNGVNLFNFLNKIGLSWAFLKKILPVFLEDFSPYFLFFFEFLL